MLEMLASSPELYSNSAVTVTAEGSGFGGLIGLAVAIFFVVAYWKIFTKAGEAGWKSLIPFYNFYITLRIIGKPTWWILMFFIPLVNIIFLIKIQHGLSKAFGKGVLFTCGLIFLTPIFVGILGFGPATYVKADEDVNSNGEDDSQFPPTPPKDPTPPTPPTPPTSPQGPSPFSTSSKDSTPPPTPPQDSTPIV